MKSWSSLTEVVVVRFVAVRVTQVLRALEEHEEGEEKHVLRDHDEHARGAARAMRVGTARRRILPHRRGEVVARVAERFRKRVPRWNGRGRRKEGGETEGRKKRGGGGGRRRE